MIKKVAVIALVIVASLSVAGCTVGLPSSSSPTPTPAPTQTVTTPTPAADLSSHYNTRWEAKDGIIVRQFTKSVNDRGNTVYKGVVRSTSQSESAAFTIVTELTDSKDQTLQLYNKSIADRLNEGFVARPDWVTTWIKNTNWPTGQIWMGQRGSEQYYIMYQSAGYPVNSWELTTEAMY